MVAVRKRRARVTLDHPQKPLPPEARINRRFINHSLTLSDEELQSLLRGRSEGSTVFLGALFAGPCGMVERNGPGVDQIAICAQTQGGCRESRTAKMPDGDRSSGANRLTRP
jgi:hypothetical protein